MKQDKDLMFLANCQNVRLSEQLTDTDSLSFVST